MSHYTYYYQLKHEGIFGDAVDHSHYIAFKEINKIGITEKIFLNEITQKGMKLHSCIF